MWLCLILFTGFLMVSSWRFWSGKEISIGQPASVPDWWRCWRVVGAADCVVFGVDADPACAGVPGFGGDGAAGLLVEQGAAARGRVQQAMKASWWEMRRLSSAKEM